VRNYSGYGKYRPAPLRNHIKAKAYFARSASESTGAVVP